MKLDIVSALYGLEPGGGEISTRILARELLDHGVDVSVVSSRKEAAAEPGAEILQSLTWLPSALVLYLPNRVTDWMFKTALMKRWRERKPDVVLVEDQLSIVGVVAAVEHLRREGQQIALAMTQMWEVDSEFFFKFRPWPIAKLFVHRFRAANALAKKMDFHNACTQYMRTRTIERLGVPEEKVGVIHTIALKEIPPFNGVHSAKPILLAPGRINPEKGSLFFLDVVRMLAKRRRDFEAIFLGGGPYEGRIRKIIEREGLTDVCTVTGKIPYEKFVQYYGAATAIVAPIMYPCGYTRVVLEALYAGKPVITFDQGSMPEIIVNGVTGQRVSPWSVSEFTDACELFINNPQWARGMSEACRQMALDHADIQKAAPELMTALRSAHEKRLATV